MPRSPNKIQAARDEGDLSENSGYHAANDEQGQMQARIITLQHILENARVCRSLRTEGVVGPGITVTIRFVKDDDEATPARLAPGSGAPIEVYSPRSPLGAAIMGKRSAKRPPALCRTAVRPRSRSWWRSRTRRHERPVVPVFQRSVTGLRA